MSHSRFPHGYLLLFIREYPFEVLPNAQCPSVVIKLTNPVAFQRPLFGRLSAGLICRACFSSFLWHIFSLSSLISTPSAVECGASADIRVMGHFLQLNPVDAGISLASLRVEHAVSGRSIQGCRSSLRELTNVTSCALPVHASDRFHRALSETRR